MDLTPRVIAVHAKARHGLTKTRRSAIRLIAGFGVEGDAHAGVTVQHLYDKAKDPAQPNLRQVHLIQAELFETLAGRGFDIHPGAMGENITTRGVDLIRLPKGARLAIGGAVIEITGLRGPCTKLEKLGKGLAHALIARDPQRRMLPLCGVMGVVVEGGVLTAGDDIKVLLPAEPHALLETL